MIGAADIIFWLIRGRVLDARTWKIKTNQSRHMSRYRSFGALLLLQIISVPVVVQRMKKISGED